MVRRDVGRKGRDRAEYRDRRRPRPGGRGSERLFDRGLVAADVVWGGRRRPVQGRFHGQYVLENGRLHVKLEGVDAGAAGEPGPSLWVPAEAVTRPDPLVLRSEIWELPAGTERDFVLRSVPWSSAIRCGSTERPSSWAASGRARWNWCSPWTCPRRGPLM